MPTLVVPGPDDVRRGRLERLRANDADARRALTRLVTDARVSVTEVRVRRELVRRNEPFEGDLSDRKVPPESERPPAARLLSPRGVPLRLYLIALLEAQCKARPDRSPKNRRPIRRGDPGQDAWLDLIAAVAESEGRAYRATSDDNRERQLKRAIQRLAAPEVRLVALPAGDEPTGKFEGFLLLHEAGDPEGTAIRYKVPAANAQTFTLPLTFFTQGWVHVLTNSEIVAYMMIAATLSAPNAARQYPDGAHLDASERLARFGLSKDAYDLLPILVGYGLLTATTDPNRRSDGTVDEYDPDSPPSRNRYQLVPAGFDALAIDTVLSSLA